MTCGECKKINGKPCFKITIDDAVVAENKQVVDYIKSVNEQMFADDNECFLPPITFRHETINDIEIIGDIKAFTDLSNEYDDYNDAN